MLRHDVDAYVRRVDAFGWKTVTIDGHDMSQILEAFREAAVERSRPVMIVARTLKGQGISFLENADGWHGKALDDEREQQAFGELSGGDHEVRGTIAAPEGRRPERAAPRPAVAAAYETGRPMATRSAYGAA